MGENDILLQIRGDIADVKAKLSEFKELMAKARAEAKKLGEESKNSWQMISAGWASLVYLYNQVKEKLVTLVTVIKELSDAAGESESVDIKLISTMKSHNIGAAEMVKAYQNLSEAMMVKTGIDDEQIKTAMRLLTIMGVGPGLMKEALEATLAVASTGRDLETSTKAVGLAMNGEYRQLGQLIPELRNLERKGGDVHLILRTIAGSMGKVEEAMGDSYVKKVQRMTTAWGEFKELLGNYLLPTLKSIVDEGTKTVHILGGLMGDKSTAWKLRQKSYLEKEIKSLQARPLDQDIIKDGWDVDTFETWRKKQLDGLRYKLAVLNREITDQQKADEDALKKGQADHKTPKLPDQREASERLSAESRTLKAKIEGYKAEEEAAKETNDRIISDRELALKQGTIVERQFLDEKTALENENAQITIESLKKQEAATIASYERRKALGLKPVDLERVKEEETGALAKIRGDLEKARQQQAEKGNQGMMAAIDYSNKFASAVRNGELATMEELARQEGEVLRLRVDRGDVLPSDALQIELEWADRLLEKKKQNLEADLQATTGDAERKKIVDAIRIIQEQLAETEAKRLKMEEARRATSELVLSRETFSREQELAAARLVGDYDEQYRVELALVWLERDRLLLQKGLTEEQKKAIRNLSAIREKDAELMRTPTGKLAVALREEAKELTDLYGQLRSTVQNAFEGMNESLTDFVMDGKLSFKDLANSIIRDMIRIAIQQSITGPLAAAGSSWLSSMSTPAPGSFNSNVGAWAETFSATHHDGGKVGGRQNSWRIVPNFNLFPRRHAGGLAPDERMVINKVGERYITEEQNNWLTTIARNALGASGPKTVEIKLENKSSQPLQATQGATSFDMKKMIVTCVIEDFNSNGPTRRLFR